MKTREPTRIANRQRGFSVVLVLAIIVLLGGLLAYAVTLTSAMHSSLAQEVAAARALQASRAGLEWARHRVRIGAVPSCVATTNLAIPLSSGNMPVTVRCVETLPSFTEGAPPVPVRIFQLTAIACMPAAAGTCPNPVPTSNYVQRQLTGITEFP
jgi:Tfp pilus assembly protein PilX